MTNHPFMRRELSQHASPHNPHMRSQDGTFTKPKHPQKMAVWMKWCVVYALILLVTSSLLNRKAQGLCRIMLDYFPHCCDAFQDAADSVTSIRPKRWYYVQLFVYWIIQMPVSLCKRTREEMLTLTRLMDWTWAKQYDMYIQMTKEDPQHFKMSTKVKIVII